MDKDIQYFRLKMADRDGSFTYSEIRRIMRGKENGSIRIVVNPVRDVLTLYCSSNELAGTKAVIVDASGKARMEFSLKAGRQEVDIHSLGSGIYYLRSADGALRFVVAGN